MANINRNFGKLIDGAVTYAPRSLVIDGREIWNPRAETYARAGYLPIDASAPTDLLSPFAFQSPIMKRTSFLGVLKGLVGLQLQLLQRYWLGHRLGLL